jgi:gamma-glutamyl-gamma-aminobutyrate hydrolase PuuD
MPRVALSFSPAVGGNSSEAVRRSLKTEGAEVDNADYREVCSLSKEDAEEIFKDPDKLDKAFDEAIKKAETALKDADALVIPGNNAMVDPRLYGGEKSDSMVTDLPRSIAELALIHVAVQRGMPITGICGGHQLLDVYFGGTLADLTEKQMKQQGVGAYDTVVLDSSSSFVQDMYGKETSSSTTTLAKKLYGGHSQVIKELGGKGRVAGQDLLKEVAHSSGEDKTVEAVESQFGAPIAGTQFHPEVSAEGLPGLPWEESVKHRDQKEEVAARKFFKSVTKAADTFKEKKTCLNELLEIAQQKGSPDILKPSDIVRLRREAALANAKPLAPKAPDEEEKAKKTEPLAPEVTDEGVKPKKQAPSTSIRMTKLPPKVEKALWKAVIFLGKYKAMRRILQPFFKKIMTSVTLKGVKERIKEKSLKEGKGLSQLTQLEGGLVSPEKHTSISDRMRDRQQKGLQQ